MDQFPSLTPASARSTSRKRERSPAPSLASSRLGHRLATTVASALTPVVRRLSVAIRLGGVRVHALVDTGADLSCIGSVLFSKLQQARVAIDLRPCTVNLSAEGATDLHCIGQLSLSVEALGADPTRHRVDHTFLVIPVLSHVAILGMDFLMRYHAAIVLVRPSFGMLYLDDLPPLRLRPYRSSLGSVSSVGLPSSSPMPSRVAALHVARSAVRLRPRHLRSLATSVSLLRSTSVPSPHTVRELCACERRRIAAGDDRALCKCGHQPPLFCVPALPLASVAIRAASCPPGPVQFTASPAACGRIEVVVSAHTCVPGRSEFVMSCLARLASGRSAPAGEYLFVPAPKFAVDSLFIAHTLIRLTGTSPVWVRLLNHGGRRREFRSGAVLGFLHWLPLYHLASAPLDPTCSQPALPASTVGGRLVRVGGEAPLVVKPTPASLAALNAAGSPADDSMKLPVLEVPVDVPDHLNHGERRRLIYLLNRFKSAFQLEGQPLGRYAGVQHVVDVGDARPIRQRPRQVPYAQRDEIQQQVAKMLGEGIVRPSCSPWSSPVVLAKKKDGTWRFCIDYRRLNEVTRKDASPLPRIQEVLDRLSGSSWFTSLDLAAGYHQIEMHPGDREKTAFSTPQGGHYEYLVMPFGLTNAPATFQRAMDILLSGLPFHICMCYIDDIIVHGKTFGEALGHLELVLERIVEAGLKLKPRKCEFMRRKLAFLGHVVSAAGLAPDPAKVLALTALQPPTTKQELLHFLGLASYYRRFILRFAFIAAPLTGLLKKGRDMSEWSGEHQDAFERLKERLASAPVLAYPDFSRSFVLKTDASAVAISAILSQLDEEGAEHPLGYASRALSSPKARYSATEREGLAIIWGIKYWRAYLWGRHFTIVTDHSALLTIKRMRGENHRLDRWALTLAEYDFDVVHKPGRIHVDADALTRLPATHLCPPGLPEPSLPPADQAGSHVACLAPLHIAALQADQKARALPVLEFNLSAVRRAQRYQRNLRALGDYLTHSSRLPADDTLKAWVLARAKGYALLSGVLYYVRADAHGVAGHRRLVIPRRLRHLCLQATHEHLLAGHLGIKRTFDRLQARYYWDGMYADAVAWVRSCPICASRLAPNPVSKQPVVAITVDAPFEKVAVDVVGPFRRTARGNRYAVVFVEYLTRWVQAFPISDASAAVIARLLVEHVVCVHGAPKSLIADNASHFRNELLNHVCRLLGVHQSFISVYHPQANGLVERFNRTVKTMLGKFLAINKDREWDDLLPMMVFAYNSTKQASTSFAPCELLYGRVLRQPEDLAVVDEALAGMGVIPSDYFLALRATLRQLRTKGYFNQRAAQQRMEQRFPPLGDAARFEVGQEVMLLAPPKQRRKLGAKWDGPPM